MKFILCIFSILIFINCYSQNSILSSFSGKPYHYLKLAEKAKTLGDTYSAIYYYEKYLDIKSNNIKIQNKLAHQYFISKNYSESAKLFFQIYNSNTKKNQTALFYYALSQKMSGNYDNAIKYFNECKKSKLDKKLKKLHKIEIEGCSFAISSIHNPKDVEVIHLDSLINHAHIDFSPFFVNDSTIIYATLITNKANEYSIYDSVSFPLSKLYFAYKYDSVWKKGDLLPEIINSKYKNTGNGTFSPDYQRFYFTLCEKNWQNKTICSIYISYYENDKWQKPKKLNKDINNPNYTSTQPTVGTSYNPDLEIIYFSSDRPDGRGGMDLWYTIYNKKKNTFIQPKNLGSKINTFGNEITPVYNNTTKTLYFSSDGKPGMGAYDIFKSTGELKSWISVKNLGYPLNSNVDDIYYVINKNQNEGFIVSNRKDSYILTNEYCCYDIFSFSYLNSEQIAIRGELHSEIDSTLEKYLNKGIEYRDSSIKNKNKYLNNAIVSLYLSDIELNDSIYITSDTTDNTGKYFFYVERDQDYKLIIHDKENYKGQISVSTKNISSEKDAEINLAPVKIDVLPEDPLIIKNIYYEFNKSELADEAKSTLDSTLVQLLENMSDIIIEISSHTDNIGDEDYNMKLSEERAKNVVEYLISKGIYKNRLVHKGYGETMPIAPNTNPDGTDNPENRKRNRRTEFRIIGIKQSITFN
ncbi:MAG: OmpA family protein [Bacteroidales bacterium]|nr:OmpA family protein [Bacteroidales bacterium]